MDPWTAIAKAIIYPFVKAMADAWYDARVRYNVSMEEIASELDKERASRFRDAVARERVQSLTPSRGHPLQPGATPGGGGDLRADLRAIAERVLSRRNGPPPQGVVDRKPGSGGVEPETKHPGG
jgi:hypothetical protein